STYDQVLQDLQAGQQALLRETQAIGSGISELQATVQQLSEQLRRNFTREWNFRLKEMDAECPSTFTLMAKERSAFRPKDWVSQEYELWLLCQHPPGPHAVGKAYPVRQAEEWWVAVSPWLKHLIEFAKFAVPMAGAVGEVGVDEASFKAMKPDIGLLEEIT